MQKNIRLAHSCAVGAREAVREFHASVAQPDMTLVIFFCSSEYDLDAAAEEMSRLFAGVPVMGCTTAGEIGPGGYREHSLTGVSFSADVCTAVTGEMSDLRGFEFSAGQALGKHLLKELEHAAPQVNERNSFAFLLIDGLSEREEGVARALQSALGKIPMVGGSAGDGLNFGMTHVYIDGTFRTAAAVAALVTTPLPLTVFKTQHFVPTDQRLVITRADPAHRVVKEINGMPAAPEYARLLGVEVSDLSPKRFAASPIVVLIDGNNYVRSIQKVNSDDSITFFCAIDEGVVLRLAEGIDLVENMEQAFAKIRTGVGPPALVLGCDCILRKLEVLQKHSEGRVENILQSNNVVGFNTYGEQFRGVHVNQTLAGVALGELSAEARDE